MQKTGEDKNYIYFMDHFQYTPVQVIQDKKTGEIFFNADDVVKILGLGDSITAMARLLTLILRISKMSRMSIIKKNGKITVRVTTRLPQG